MVGPVKIGCSDKPIKRLETFMVWSPFPLEIIAEIDGSFYLEKKLHMAFNYLRKHSEWFDVDDALLEVIDAINAGTFDVSTLPSPNPNFPLSNKARLPAYVAKQAALSRRVWIAQMRHGFKCPVRYHDVFKEERTDDLEIVLQYLEAPEKVGEKIEGDWAKRIRSRGFYAGVKA